MTTKIIIFLSCLTMLLLSACYFCVKTIISNRKKIKELKSIEEALKINMAALVDHERRLGLIKTTETEFLQKIEKAKSYEEINNIIIDIIVSNNNRVQNTAKR